jgi:hypothetical protein
MSATLPNVDSAPKPKSGRTVHTTGFAPRYFFCTCLGSAPCYRVPKLCRLASRLQAKHRETGLGEHTQPADIQPRPSWSDRLLRLDLRGRQYVDLHTVKLHADTLVTVCCRSVCGWPYHHTL